MPYRLFYPIGIIQTFRPINTENYAIIPIILNLSISFTFSGVRMQRTVSIAIKSSINTPRAILSVISSLLLSSAFLVMPAQADDLAYIFNLAADNDPQIREARADFKAFHTNVEQGLSQLLPTLTLTANTARESSGSSTVPVTSVAPAYSWGNSYNSHGYGLNVRQNLMDFQAWYNFKAIKASDRAQAANLARLEQQLIQRVAEAYFDVLRSQDNLTSFQGELDAAERILEQTTQRFEVGLIPVTDVYESQANHDLAKVGLLVEQNRLNQRFEALQAITGEAHSDLESLSNDFPIVPADPVGIEQWVSFAMDNNLDIKAAELNFASKEEEAKAARASLFPVLDISAGYNWSKSNPPAGLSFFSSGIPSERASVALNFTLPLYTGGLNNARKRQAYYSRDASEEVLLRTRRNSTMATRNSYRSLESHVLTVAARAQAIVSAQSQLEATEVGAEVGTRNIVDVVVAQRLLYQAQRDHANARYDYVIETLNLKQAGGVLSPQDVLELNNWLD